MMYTVLLTSLWRVLDAGAGAGREVLALLFEAFAFLVDAGL
jgi:hypothetical protein